MSRITQQLLRRRSQHNQMCLSTLQEISLHQQQLIRIEYLDVLCRHLKIVYLQNNIIDKIQGLSKLKEMEYLNMALNNIRVIQNLEGCENLKKLDMTVNFVDVTDLEASTKCLAALPSLKELYMTGNPCQQWEGCRDYIVAQVTGELVIRLPKLHPDQFIRSVINHRKQKQLKKKQEEQQKKKQEFNQRQLQGERVRRLCEELERKREIELDDDVPDLE